MLSNYLILCHPFLLWPSIFPSIKVFSNESPLHVRWPTYWSFSISPSSEYLELISFRIASFGHLAVQGTLKNLLEHGDLKTSVLRHSAFFMVHLSQLPHDYWKNHSFVGEVMPLLFNTLSRFVIAFLPRSNVFYLQAKDYFSL